MHAGGQYFFNPLLHGTQVQDRLEGAPVRPSRQRTPAAQPYELATEALVKEANHTSHSTICSVLLASLHLGLRCNLLPLGQVHMTSVLDCAYDYIASGRLEDRIALQFDAKADDRGIFHLHASCHMHFSVYFFQPLAFQ